MTKRFVYADNAATTRVSPGVLQAMMPFLDGSYGNASSLYSLGREARRAVETAREQVAASIGASSPGEIIFTPSGTISDNIAISGSSHSGKRHFIVSSIEHPAVLNTTVHLGSRGYEITYLPVSPDGIVRLQDILACIRPDTALVSVMYANNETGMIQPVREIGEICREHKITFHSDAVQAAGTLQIDVHRDNIDMLSLSAHKFRGPKGIGALYVRDGLVLPKFIFGGNQERGRFAGTENVAGIVGFAKAIQSLSDTERIRYLRDGLLKRLLEIPGSHLNGAHDNRLPGNISISFDNVEGESLVLLLDLQGIAVSTASACSSGNNDPSHVLLAMGVSEDRAKNSIRITLGDDNTGEDVEYIAKVVPEAVNKLRSRR